MSAAPDTWPPTGPLAGLWAHVDLVFTDEEKVDLLALLRRWQGETSPLTADDQDDWSTVELHPPDWLP